MGILISLQTYEDIRQKYVATTLSRITLFPVAMVGQLVFPSHHVLISSSSNRYDCKDLGFEGRPVLKGVAPQSGCLCGSV